MDNTSEREEESDKKKRKEERKKDRRGSATVDSPSVCLIHLIQASKIPRCTSPSGIMQGRMPSSGRLVHLRPCSRQRPHHAIAPSKKERPFRDMEWRGMVEGC